MIPLTHPAQIDQVDGKNKEGHGVVLHDPANIAPIDNATAFLPATPVFSILHLTSLHLIS